MCTKAVEQRWSAILIVMDASITMCHVHAKSERTLVRAPHLIATNTASVNVCLATYHIAHQMAQQLSKSLSGVVKVFLSQFVCPMEQTLSNDWGDRRIIPVFVLLHHLLD